MSLDIGFIGLGIMGEAMARNLLKSGKFNSVTVYNRTASKVRIVIYIADIALP
jgi:3-hydroxyisobutyrate dehydrogenase-like beta-hydroxyacid dehydrogenase